MPRTGGEQRRSTLVEEAIRQFGREGYSGASLDDIARAVGVRKQTLLYYFPTKDALLEACLQAAGVRLAEVIAEALEDKEGYWERAEAVIGSLTEASVLNAVVGADKGRASLRRREKEVVAFVRAALEPAPEGR